MPTGKTCGNCVNFTRIKGWGRGRNGLCDFLDYNCHSDSSYAKGCRHYVAKRYGKADRTRQNTFSEVTP